MLDQTFQEAVHIIDKLEEHGFKAYFVGGCVRDFLLKRKISDIDIATSAPPEDVQRMFSNVIPVGLEHGTVIVRHLHKSYEVTTFRIDGNYSDNRHPDNVEFIQTIDEDLKRRDFTINALAMDNSGTIIDLFNGIKDLDQKVIRTVGKGSARFHEDPLRIIRALRFSSQLGFVINPNTLSDMQTISPEITQLAVERLRVEITKFFGGAYINNGIEYLKSTEIYKYLPVMINYPYIMYEIPIKVSPLGGFSEVVVFFHYLEPSVSIKEWFDAWKCSNQEKRDVKQLITSIDYYLEHGLNKWFVYCLSASYFDAFVRLINVLYPNHRLTKNEVISIHDSLVIHSREELQVNGHDLISLFPNKRRGPWMQEILNDIEKHVVLNHVPNKNNELKDWIKWNPPATN
ncbi:CCA tRNA nucleotidyltransferase [Virgibacillus necropolis]|uniref:CCA tRNA nucleotidyltransferase n=1 Tax=Virgibacillus necropolis TaxID=163877 RepID=UPI003850CC4E